MIAMRSRATARSAGCLLRCRLMSRSDVKPAQRACRNQNRQRVRSGATARSAGCLLRCRLMSRSDVKPAQRACRNQNRQFQWGGRV